MTQSQKVIPLRGGLDLVTPPLLVKEGCCIAAQNYEAEARGYRRVEGYERFDGQPKPSEATYEIVLCRDGVPLSEGDIVNGVQSGASGTVLADTDGDEIALVDVWDEFQADEALQVNGRTIGISESANETVRAEDYASARVFRSSAIERRRNVIGNVPGSGPIRGIATYAGEVYAWRDDSTGTSGRMHKAHESGWQELTFGRVLRFTGGTSALVEGETVEGSSSGATATMKRVVLNDGAWNNDGKGYLVLADVSGSFSNGESLSGDSGAATADGADEAITLPPGGAYRSIVTNFYAAADRTRLYVANGVGPAFEWDGETLAPVLTGVDDADEKPEFVAEHRLHLFVAYKGGSLQFSRPGNPLLFDAIVGAGEIGFGEEITGLKSNTKDSLIVAGRTRLGYLVGQQAQNFEMRTVSEDSGAIKGTLEIVGKPVFLDDIGVRDMRSADTYGNWQIGTMTRLVEPLFARKRRQGIKPMGAYRVRAKDQYRLFWEDGTGILIYFGRKDPEPMTLALPFTPSTFHSGTDAEGSEILLAGDTGGWVYELDKGTSADGEPIQAYLRTSFMDQGAPNVVKRYHRARLEGEAGGDTAELAMSADFTYGDPDIPAAPETEFMFAGGGGYWNEALWNRFLWSNKVQGQTLAEMNGIGENVSVVFMSEATYETPHTFSALTINYSPRRKIR